MNKGWIKDYEYRRAAQMLQKFYGWNISNQNTWFQLKKDLSSI